MKPRSPALQAGALPAEPQGKPLVIHIHRSMCLGGFPGGSAVKNLLSMQKMQETQVQYLDWEDTLEEDMATHSSILAWRIPWTEELGGVHNWSG